MTHSKKNNLKKFFAFTRLFFICCAILSLPFPLFLAPAYAQFEAEDNIPNEFILQVLMLPDWRISEAIFAYEQNGKYYLPIQELSENFEFFIETELDEKFARGFASREENIFILDASRNELTFKGERETLPDDAVLTSDFLATNDLYVQIEILNKIWPVEMRIDLANITIQTEPEEELSFMRKRARLDKQKRMEMRQELRKQERELLPFRENPYDFFGKPVIDYQAIYQFETEDDELTGSNIFTGIQHVGKMIADYSANFRLEDKNIKRPDTIRFRLSRKAFGDDYIFLPAVKRFEAADVTLRQRDLIAGTKTGRGFVLSNDNRDRGRDFDQITIEGVGPPGWEIELYNNEELVEFGVVPEDGQYFFEDVTLNFGNNQIKILFFGPQGQVREETKNYSAGGNMLSPGRFVYESGILDADRNFILLDNEPRTEPRGFVKNGHVAYGLNTRMTLFGGFAVMPESVEDKKYITTGAAMDTGLGLLEIEAYNEVGGGNAVNTNYISQLFGFRTNLSLSFFNHFESKESGFGSNKKTFEMKAQINRNIRLFTVPMGLRFNATHTERESGQISTALGAIQTFARGGLRLSNNITTRLTEYMHERSNGTLSATMREGPWQIRGGLNYNLYPENELSSMNANIRYKTENDFQASFNFAHDFLSSDYNAGIQIGQKFDAFLGTVEGGYTRGAGWDFVLRATTSLHPYTEHGNYRLDSTSKRTASPVYAHIFLDNNGDGIFNDQDEPIPDARIKLGGGRSKETSDEDGHLITNAPSNKPVNIRLDSASLTDPYYLPDSEGFSTVPIAGKIIRADFPVVQTGSIEGTTFRNDTGHSVAGLTLNLVNENGEILKTVDTAFDGYYAFEFIPPGTYNILADPSHGVETIENPLTLISEDLFHYGHDIFISIPDEDPRAQENQTTKDLDHTPEIQDTLENPEEITTIGE